MRHDEGTVKGNGNEGGREGAKREAIASLNALICCSFVR